MKVDTTGRPTAEDHDLVRRIVNFLNTCGVQGLEALRVEAEGGTVIMRGWLPSAYEKWLCIECCRRVGGVFKVVDEVGVEAT